MLTTPILHVKLTASILHLSPRPSVGLSVCLESVLWQNGWVDLDAIWGGERGWLRDVYIRLGWLSAKGKGQFWGWIWGSHCNKWGWCRVVVREWCTLRKLLWEDSLNLCEHIWEYLCHLQLYSVQESQLKLAVADRMKPEVEIWRRPKKINFLTPVYYSLLQTDDKYCQKRACDELTGSFLPTSRRTQAVNRVWLNMEASR